ncbi:hypothetical protein HA402_003061 [Bradysia odoriphaga]|nr:hypothetical protein HA402_003061 [Bradysia odoriphaga]
MVELQQRQKRIDSLQKTLKSIHKDLDNAMTNFRAKSNADAVVAMRIVYHGDGGECDDDPCLKELLRLYKKEDDVRDEIRDLKRETRFNQAMYRGKMTEQHNALLQAMEQWHGLIDNKGSDKHRGEAH